MTAKIPSAFDSYAAEVEVPRADLAANTAADRQRRKLVRRMGYAAAGVLVLGVAAVGNSKSDAPASVVAASPSVGKAEAMRYVTDWLDGHGTIDGWLSSEGSPLETHRIAVSIGGVSYIASVVVETGGGQSYVLGDPEITPVVDLGGQPVTQDWPVEAKPATVSQNFPAAIEQWLAAYTSGDPERLRQAVGDPDPEHSYVPLSGWTASGAGVFAEVVAPDEAFVLARVSYTMSPTVTDGSAPWSVRVQIDVMVAGASTAAPRVVAWGPAYTGQQLQPYQNAYISETDPETVNAPASSTSTVPVDSSTTVAATLPPTTVPPATAPPETAPPATPAPAPVVDAAATTVVAG